MLCTILYVICSWLRRKKTLAARADKDSTWKVSHRLSDESAAWQLEEFDGIGWLAWAERLVFLFESNYVQNTAEKKVLLHTLCGVEMNKAVQALLHPAGRERSALGMLCLCNGTIAVQGHLRFAVYANFTGVISIRGSHILATWQSWKACLLIGTSACWQRLPRQRLH